METNGLNWKGVHELLDKRIKELHLPKGQLVTSIDMRPPSDKPCFYSSEMIDSNHPKIANLVSPSEVLNEIIKEGKREEALKDKNQIMNLLEDFFEKLKRTLTSFLDEFAIEMMNELSKKLLKKGTSMEFIESYLDGEFNSDSECLEALEKLIRSIDKSNFAFEWTTVTIKNILDSCLASSDQITRNFEADLRNLFENFDHFPIPTKLEALPTLSNNIFDAGIVQSLGVDCNNWSDNFYSFSSGGHFSANNIETGKTVFELKLLGEQNSNTDCFRLSPDGNTIGFVFSKSRNIHFYDARGGVKLNLIKKTHDKLAGACLWLNPENFCVGYHDGTIQCFSFLKGSVRSKVKIPNGQVISTMEANDNGSLFAMNNDNTLYLVNIVDSKVVWSKKDVFMGCECIFKYGLKKSCDGTRLALTGDCSNTVKALSISDQKELWLANIDARTWGVQWVPGDTYLVVLGFRPFKIAVLRGRDGHLILNYDAGFQNYLVSFSVHLKTKQIIIGDFKGVIHRLKIKE